MKESMIRAEKMVQMRRVLEDMMHKIATGTYRTTEFCKEKKLPTVFPTLVVEAGLIKPVDKAGNRIIYTNLMPRSVIKDNHVENVINLMLSYNRKVYERKQASLKAKKEAKAKETKNGIEKLAKAIPTPEQLNPLSKFTFAELKEEIEKRGVVFQPKLEDIDVVRIIDELKRRGYEGTITKIEEYKI